MPSHQGQAAGVTSPRVVGKNIIARFFACAYLAGASPLPRGTVDSHLGPTMVHAGKPRRPSY